MTLRLILVGGYMALSTFLGITGWYALLYRGDWLWGSLDILLATGLFFFALNLYKGSYDAK